MPEKDNVDFDNLEINTEDILPAEELEAEAEAVADELPVDPAPEEVVEEDGAGEDNTDVSDDAGENEEADELVDVIRGLRDTVEALNARIQASEAKLAFFEQREAARKEKLSGFFAPVKDGKDPDADPLPRIEKKYIF